MMVMFSTLLIAFLNGSQSVFFAIGQANGGDFDMTVTGLTKDQFYHPAEPNFYLDV